MVVLREQTLSVFDISKQKHSGCIFAEKKPNLKHKVIVTSNDMMELTPNANKPIKHSMYNYYVRRNDIAFLWNTASDACVLLNKQEAEVYENNQNAVIDSDYFAYLYDFGFYVDSDLDEVFRIDLLRKKHAYSYPENEHIDIEILPTQTCNARCFYCFEQNYNSLTMRDETIRMVLNYIFANVKPHQEVCFIWFGGEPLLGQRIIDKIFKEINVFYEGKLNYYSSITTNNSLLTSDILKKFEGLWNVKDVLTTIDGYQEEHNLRKAYIGEKFNAYERTLINLHSLLKMGIKTTCRINLDKENIHQLNNILDDLTHLGDYPNFSIQITTLRNKTTNEIIRNKYYSVNEYSEFYNETIPLLYNAGFVSDPLQQLPMRDSSNCIACALNKVVINSNGKLFKCVQDSLADENSIGDCKNGVRNNWNYTKWYRDIDDLGKDCERCMFLPCCQGGCKFYRLNPSFDQTPCFRKKYYIEYIIDRIITEYSWEVEQCHIL